MPEASLSVSVTSVGFQTPTHWLRRTSISKRMGYATVTCGRLAATPYNSMVLFMQG